MQQCYNAAIAATSQYFVLKLKGYYSMTLYTETERLLLL